MIRTPAKRVRFRYFVLSFPAAVKFLGSWMGAGRALKGESNIEGLIVLVCCFGGFFAMLSLLFLADANALDAAWHFPAPL